MQQGGQHALLRCCRTTCLKPWSPVPSAHASLHNTSASMVVQDRRRKGRLVRGGRRRQSISAGCMKHLTTITTRWVGRRRLALVCGVRGLTLRALGASSRLWVRAQGIAE